MTPHMKSNRTLVLAILLCTLALCVPSKLSARKAPKPMKQGDKLKAITILEALYSRGTGGIFIGFNNEDKKMVFVKTLFSDLAKEKYYKRQFRREAIAYRKLKHPNIVKYVDSGFDKGRHFIATEFVKGKTLASLIKAIQLPVDTSLKIMGHLADAIAHAHEKGMLHCDLRPENIMINEEGEIKLVDFGNVKKVGDKGHLDTNSGIRSPYYSSPEQNQGHKLDELSDLYCLGLLFYELLTGQRALKGASLLELTAFQMRGKLPPPSRLNSKVPPILDELVLQLLERKTDKRHKSAVALIDHIKDIKEKLSKPPPNDGFHQLREDTEAHILRREFKKALPLAKQMVKLRERSPEPHILLGKIHSAMGKASKAIISFELACAMAPQNKDYLLVYAVALYKLERFKDAKAKFKQCLKHDPDNLYAKRYLQLIEAEK